MDQNDRNETEGLFQENETPKRENPYLKKNREKAKPEKTSVRESERSFAPAAAPAQGEGKIGYTSKRTFSDWMFEHVKLIATIATILVVLSLVLITDVVGMIEDMVFQTQQSDKEELTLTYVQGLSEKSTPITWSDLDRFRRDESRADDSVTWMISVKGTSYEIWVSGANTAKPPFYVYLYDMKTGDRMILGEDNFDAFIKAHSKK